MSEYSVKIGTLTEERSAKLVLGGTTGTTKYVIKVDYASGGKQVHADLTPEQAEQGAGAFLRDLFRLYGRGVRQVCVAIQEEVS